jgi:SAM-dependent methyltransferase
MTESKTAGITPTDWDQYYRNTSFFSRFTRPAICGALVRALRRYSAPNPSIAELGGAGSCAFETVRRVIKPSVYHVIDANELGLELLAAKAGDGNLRLHRRDILSLDLDLQLDAVFSLGLIEHFDIDGTREAIRSHLKLLKKGGIAVITFPTPTLRYRMTRGAIQLAGKWVFHDERPLRAPEVIAAVGDLGRVLDNWLIWKIPLTQRLMVIQKY